LIKVTVLLVPLPEIDPLMVVPEGYKINELLTPVGLLLKVTEEDKVVPELKKALNVTEEVGVKLEPVNSVALKGELWVKL
jgi:hypothetical protein